MAVRESLRKKGHLEAFLESDAEMERFKDIVSGGRRAIHDILKLYKLIDISGEGGISKNTK